MPMTDEQITKLVTDSIAAATKPLTDALTPLTASVAEITKNQKVLADTYAADKDAAAKAKADADAAAKAGQPAADPKKAPTTAVTPEDVSKAIAEALKAQQTQAQSDAARNAFIADKLKGVPAAYTSQLGTDPAKWATEEQAIRDKFKADATAAGFVAKDVNGAPAAGTSAGAAAAAANSPANSAQVAQFKAAGLGDGEAAFAASLTIPSLMPKPA